MPDPRRLARTFLLGPAAPASREARSRGCSTRATAPRPGGRIRGAHSARARGARWHRRGQIVFVGHSQGTAYSSLVAAERPASLLVHLCPRLGGLEEPPNAPGPFREGVPFPATSADGTSAWDPDTAISAMYRRLSPEAAQALAQRLRPMAMPAEEYPLTEHPDVATALIYAADDELFDPDWQRFMALELLGIEPIEVPTGHFPMVEDPGGLADLLNRLAREHP
ncbi:MAG TPA: alpha/beta hydrolase, partial [Solirubrobacterales bacterium]|nr:alpha/beta hydrolase [Solirubrobacterales bacterium]